MGQVGLFGDDSGVIKFTLWADTDVRTLEEGEAYEIHNVVVDEYEGQYSVEFKGVSSVALADGLVENSVEGALVDVKSGSGLIKRCPEEDCSRPLNSGRCASHGPVDGEFDLRIKAVIDDGSEAHDVVFGQESTTAVTGISLDEAESMAMDALDTDVVENKITAQLLGTYFKIDGPQIGDNVVVNEATILGGPDDDSISALQDRVRGYASSEDEQAEASA